MERRVPNLKPSPAVNHHEAEATEDSTGNGCPTAMMKQQLEEFLLQEATTGPAIPARLPDSIQAHQDDDQTIVSEVTMHMEDIMGPLYQTPAAALAQVMEDPNDEEVANLFQVQRRTVARPPPPPPVTTPTTSIAGKSPTTQIPLKLPPNISEKTKKKVRPSPVSVLPSNQSSKHSEDSGKKQSSSKNDPSKKQVGWLEQQQDCENGSVLVRDPMSPPPSDNLISDGIQPLPQPPELNRSDQVNGNHQVPGAHAVPGLPNSTTVGSTRLLGTRSINSSESESSQEEHAFDAVLCGSSEFADMEDPEGDNTVVRVFGGEYMSQTNHTELEEFDALPLSTLPATSSRRHCTAVLVISLVVELAAAAVVIPLMVRRHKTTSAGTSPSPAPSPGNVTVEEDPPETYPPFQNNLPFWVLKALEEGPMTAESRANAWMWNDPYLNNYSEEQQRHRFGLATLYFSTNGDNWLHNDHWLDYDTPVCQWFSKAGGDEAALHWHEWSGEQVPPLCEEDSDPASNLLTLDLHSNNMSGPLPPSFFAMIKAPYVDVSYNDIDGLLPYMPWNMSYLEVINIAHNQIGGDMRAEPGLEIGNLRLCFTHDNVFQQYNGGLAFLVMPKLQVMDMSNNLNYREPVPHLQHCKDLRYYNVSNNRFFGELTSEVGVLSKLEVLDFSGNIMMTGTVPDSYNGLIGLEVFNVMDTGLTGPLPNLFCERQAEGLLQIMANCSSIQCCE